MSAARVGDTAKGCVVTGVQTFPRNPAPLEAEVPVTFAEIFAEAQSEAGRYEIHRDDLLARANETDDESLKAEFRLAAKSRARSAQVYGAMMLLIDRVRDDAVILRRLRELAGEAKVRAAIDAPKSEKLSEKDEKNDSRAGATNSESNGSSDGPSAASND